MTKKTVFRPNLKLLPRTTHLNIRHRLVYALVLIVVLTCSGTMGYYTIEREWTLLDAFYMTIITLTTVGYGEIHTLSPNGRLFTVILLLFSVTTLGYALSTVASFVIEGQLHTIIRGRRMDKQISRLTNHIIVCGGGRTGKHVATEFHKTRTPFVIIEQSPDVLMHIHNIDKIPHLIADATEDESLIEAGIERARGLIAALGDDKDNVFIVLSARALNPGLRIIARCNQDANEEKLRKAGANDIVSPNAIGGLRMASILIRPTVVSFLDEMMQVTGETLRFEEVSVMDIPGLENHSLAQANIGRRTGLLVTAIKSTNGMFHFNPGGNTVLKKDDTLVVLGTRKQITQLHEVMCRLLQSGTMSQILDRISEE